MANITPIVNDRDEEDDPHGMIFQQSHGLH